MSVTAITGARILADDAWRDGHAVIVSAGEIIEVIRDIPTEADVIELSGGLLVPGFIDTQVNGGGGVLFNDQPTVEGIRTIAGAHRRFGTTGLFPTLISDDLDVVARAIVAVDAAIVAGVPGVLGIHIEGPFLNSAKRGVHDASKFRVLDDKTVQLLSLLKHGKTLVTLAPECAPPGMIRALVEAGVIVAAGHTAATYENMKTAMDEGLTGVTHLFNAMTQMEGRAPGVVGTALAHSLFAGIIVDGHHVDPAALKAAWRAKGPQELMLVTDAMPTTGWDRDRFNLGDRTITAKDGALRACDGTLAGSTLDMATAVRNATAMMGIDLIDACHMASATPAAFMGLAKTHGRIARGYCADLVHLDDTGHVCGTWIGGAYQAA